MALTKPQGDMVMKLGTEQASTSGTSIDFTGIPAGTTMIVISLIGVSTNGASAVTVQLGDSGGIENTGYVGSATWSDGGGSGASSAAAFALVPSMGGTGNSISGQAVLVLEDSSDNTWSFRSLVHYATSGVYSGIGAGYKATSAVLDRVRITSANPDTFDAGAINIAYF